MLGPAALLNALQLERVYLNEFARWGHLLITLFLNRYPARVERGDLTCSGIFEYDEKALQLFISLVVM